MAQTKDEREKQVCAFVTAMVDSCAKQTAIDRERYEVALNLFKGIQDFGAERSNNPALSRVFIHEFSKIVRRAAQAAQDLIFERTDFFDLLPPEGEEQVEITQTVTEESGKKISMDALPVQDLSRTAVRHAQ